MTTDDLQRILSSEELIEPSSGFASSVMDAVHRETTQSPPLPFPWIRFAAGLIACGASAAAGAALMPQIQIFLAPVAAPIAALPPEAGYAAIISVVSLVTAYIPRLLTRLST
jgi:hypothetical protein